MDLDRVLARYDAEVRAGLRPQTGMTVERNGGVVRLVSHFGFISSWDLTEDTARAAVAEQAAHFRARGEELLWRVYDYDEPNALPSFLAAEGFEPSEPGTLMILDLATPLSTASRAEADIRRVATSEGLDDFVAAGGKAFGHEETWRRTAYADRLNDADLALFVAYVSGEAVAAARLEMGAECSFGLLFGGGVAPAHRGRGIYRALVAARVEEARRRGLKYLSTEARETSRPILAGLGFVSAAKETTWVLRP